MIDGIVFDAYRVSEFVGRLKAILARELLWRIYLWLGLHLLRLFLKTTPCDVEEKLIAPIRVPKSACWIISQAVLNALPGAFCVVFVPTPLKRRLAQLILPHPVIKIIIISVVLHLLNFLFTAWTTVPRKSQSSIVCCRYFVLPGTREQSRDRLHTETNAD